MKIQIHIHLDFGCKGNIHLIGPMIQILMGAWMHHDEGWLLSHSGKHIHRLAFKVNGRARDNSG